MADLSVQHKFSYANDLRIHYVEAGSGPLVLFAMDGPNPGILGVIRSRQ
jgi:hypothetical protein